MYVYVCVCTEFVSTVHATLAYVSRSPICIGNRRSVLQEQSYHTFLTYLHNIEGNVHGTCTYESHSQKMYISFIRLSLGSNWGTVGHFSTAILWGLQEKRSCSWNSAVVLWGVALQQEFCEDAVEILQPELENWISQTCIYCLIPHFGCVRRWHKMTLITLDLVIRLFNSDDIRSPFIISLGRDEWGSQWTTRKRS